MEVPIEVITYRLKWSAFCRRPWAFCNAWVYRGDAVAVNLWLSGDI